MSGCSAASLSTFALSEMSSACTSARTFQRDAIVSRTASRSVCVRDDQDDVDTFLGQDFGRTTADALRCAGDQRGPAAQVQVHGFLPLSNC